MKLNRQNKPHIRTRETNTTLMTDVIIALLPLMTAIIFTWFLDKSGEIRLKIVIITCQLMWLVYDIFYLNYVSAVFDVFTVISNCAGIYLVMKDRKKK